MNGENEQVRFVYVGQGQPPVNPHAQQFNNEVERAKYDPKMIERMVEAQIATNEAQVAQHEAIARMQHGQYLLDGMREIKDALAGVTVADGDQGGTLEGSRPPLKQIFTEAYGERLQLDYLELSKRYIDFYDQVMKKDQ